MKEIIEKRTISEVVGYESIDGRRFSTKEECEKYEKSAEHVIWSDLKAIIVGDIFTESQFFEDYGYGSEEFEMAVLDIRNVDCLEIANRYFASKGEATLPPECIGEKVLVNLGYEWDREISPCAKTMNQLVMGFIKNAENYYGEEYKLPTDINTLEIKIKEVIGEYESGCIDASDLVDFLKEIQRMVKKG